MELRIGRKVQAPKGPTNSSPAYRGMKTRGIRKPQLSTIDPGGVDHQQRFQEIGGPLLGVHSVTVILIFRGLPPTATIGSPLRGMVPFPRLMLMERFSNQVTSLKTNWYNFPYMRVTS